MENVKRIDNFRLFASHEIKVREGSKYVGSDGVKKKTLLLYQDARAAMARLDERFGEYGWQREHKDVHGQTFCGVSLWDDDKKTWVTKWDAGEPSKTSPAKGEASDSFKRACVNWGIGRELYTAPFIGVNENVNTNNLKVSYIDYDANRKIRALKITDRAGNIIYEFGKEKAADAGKTAQAPIVQKGGALYPAKEPQPAPVPVLTDREQEELDDAMAQMDAAPTLNDMRAIYDRYVESRFAKLLQRHGAKIKAERKW